MFLTFTLIPASKVSPFTSTDAIGDGGAAPSGGYDGASGDAGDPLDPKILSFQISKVVVVVTH